MSSIKANKEMEKNSINSINRSQNAPLAFRVKKCRFFENVENPVQNGFKYRVIPYKSV